MSLKPYLDSYLLPCIGIVSKDRFQPFLPSQAIMFQHKQLKKKKTTLKHQLKNLLDLYLEKTSLKKKPKTLMHFRGCPKELFGLQDGRASAREVWHHGTCPVAQGQLELRRAPKELLFCLTWHRAHFFPPNTDSTSYASA